MSDSHGSNLFGNNDEHNDGHLNDHRNDLYSSKRHYDEYEPFSQAMPPSSEPLFPTVPASSERPWVEPLADSMAVNESYLNQNYSASLYDSPSYFDQNSGQNAGAAEPEPEEDNTPYVLPTPNYEYEITAQSIADEITSLPVPAFTPVEPSLKPEEIEFTPPVPAAQPVVVAKPAISEKEAIFNRHYAVLMDLMQHGAWPQALAKLQAMRAEYPNVKALDNLLDEATLKAELMAEWTHKIKGRRLTVGQEWLIRRSLPFLLLLFLFISGAIFYQTFVAPSRQVVAMERANQALIEEATGLVQVGQIDEAIALFNLVLSRNPNNSAAKQGLVDASRLSGLAASYDVAIRVANSGNLKRSLKMLEAIKAKSPSFRDIDARIARVSSLLDAEHSYKLAEKSFAQRRWVDAITYYEQTQLLASDYQLVRVGLQLSAAYFMASQRLMVQWPTPEFGTEQIRDFLRKAQQLNGQDEAVATFLVQLEDFMQGERALQRNDVADAIRMWRELFDVQPGFLGGYLAEELYRAYLTLAAEIRDADPDYAKELYTLAAAMPVHDSSEARTQLQNIGAAIPAAQPTPTPKPTVSFAVSAPVAVAAAVPAAPVETPTPEPTAAPANPYQGWIGFRSTRDGSEQIYIMRADGSEQQPAPEEIRAHLDGFYQDEHRGPDGHTVFVQSATGRSDANVYVASSDGATNSTLTDYNGDEYDPVWSPSGDRVAFVANHTGNDEIWVMRADGSEQRQMTFNNWEWDKHPTWSPDGSQIAFFSNRNGQRQIWVMNSDGNSQRNLSNNVYDDWDPVWIK